MKKLTTVLLITAFMAVSVSYIVAQHDPKEMGLNAITMAAVKGQLEFLASDWTEGRMTGQKGCYMAADYIASMFKVYGIKPAGDIESFRFSRSFMTRGVSPERNRTYFQNFSLIEYSPGDNHEFSVTSGKQVINFAYRTDFSVQTSDVGTELNAPVVFVGYGFVDEENKYNDFKDVDVKGKVILRLSGYPGHRDTASAAYKKFTPQDRRARFRISRSKNNDAEKYGAIAVIEVNPEQDYSRSWSANYPFRYNTRMYEGDKRRASFSDTRMSLPGDTLSDRMNTINITMRVANEIVKGTGVSFADFEKYAMEKMKPASKTLTGKSVFLKTTVNSKIIQARNVVGVIEGEDPDEIIVIGGHYDHLGKHDGYIWNGADDNASGTVGVMTIAKAFMATGVKPKKTIVFAAWTGEEKGLLGSKYFAENPYKPVENINLYLNYDMISRDSRNDSSGVKCSMNYTEAYSQLKEVTIEHNDRYNLGLDISFRASERPSGGSDHSSFAAKDIPVFYFMAGFPPEYHQPDDHISLVNWDKMAKIIKLGFLDIWKFANTDWKSQTSSEE